MTQTSSAVTSRVLHLPLCDLTWERFEAFAHDLIARLPGYSGCHRYGGQGHAQGGIDVFADDAQMQRWAFSNKRYTKKAYQPHHAIKHVAETTYAANRYVMLLTSVASTTVRDEMGKHTKWDLWDVSDLSQKVRDLAVANPNAARELVDHHFGPRWRRDFLGLPAVAAFLSPSDFFRELLNTGRLFHHSFDLIGRSSQLISLTQFARLDRRRVAVLPGRGGIGKSRLLRAFAETVEEAAAEPAIRFLVEGVPLTSEGLDELPTQACVVVVDDSHRCDGLGLLLAYAHRRPNLKLLLATRPHGVDRIHSTLTRSGFDLREMIDLPALAPLSLEDTRDLARAAIGSGSTLSRDTIDRLVRVTRDCPLATVIGGGLLAENAIRPELLTQDELFRKAVFDGFQDEMLGNLGPECRSDLARQSLRLLAALNAIPAEGNESLLRQIAGFLNANPVEITSLVGELERVGLLIRRAGRLRLTPDVLADHILAGACLTPQNNPTGFAEQVFDFFRNSCPELVLRNLAELDWRVSASGEEESRLLHDLWASIATTFRNGGLATRVRVIELVSEAAYYQPRRALELAEMALHCPVKSDRPNQLASDDDSVLDQDDVVKHLPELLRRCAYDPDTLPRCLELLWEISLSEDCSRENVSGEAIKVIHDVAKYEHNKPIWINEFVARAIRRWSQTSTSRNQRRAILETIDLMLVKGGSDALSEGNRIRIVSFLVSPERVHEIRQAAFAVLQEMLNSGDVPVQLRAIASFQEALNGPMPYGQLTVTNEVLAEWEPDQINILTILSGFLNTHHSAVVQLRVFESVRFQAHYSSRPAVKERARIVVGQIEDSFEVRLARLLLTRLSRSDANDDFDTGHENLTAHLAERQRSRCLQTVTELWQRYPSADAAFTFLEETTSSLRAVEEDVDPGTVLWYMLDARPNESTRFVCLILANPESVLTRNLQAILARARFADATETTRLAQRALDGGVASLTSSVALHYWCDWPAGCPTSDEDIGNIRRLLANSQPAIREYALGSLHHVAVANAALALELANSVEVGDSSDVADELARLTVPSQPGHLIGFTDSDFRNMLRKFDSISCLDHWVCELMTRMVATEPETVVDFLLRRIPIEETSGYRTGFHALPRKRRRGLRGIFAAIDGHDRQVELARRVRDQAVPSQRFSAAELPRLFRAVSGNYGVRGLDVLREWIDSGDSARILGAVALLGEAGRNFVFDQREFTEHALAMAAIQGEECAERVYRAFFGLAVYFGRSGFAGEIFPQDIAVRDRAIAEIRQTDPGTRMHQLYEAIRRSAESDIQRQTDRIEDEDE